MVETLDTLYGPPGPPSSYVPEFAHNSMPAPDPYLSDFRLTKKICSPEFLVAGDRPEMVTPWKVTTLAACPATGGRRDRNGRDASSRRLQLSRPNLLASPDTDRSMGVLAGQYVR
jgi:hypothetical protein